MSNLSSFHQWILDNGRCEGTALLYEGHVRLAQEGYPRLADRLLDRKLAPKTRRSALHALRAYAMFREDPKLLKQLGMIKLPPAVRKTAKLPLEEVELEDLIQAIDDSDEETPVRAVLSIMARRGLRVGDVLRLTRAEVKEALKTGVLAFEAKGGRRLEYGIVLMREALEELHEEKGWTTVAELVAPGTDDPQTMGRLYVWRALRRVSTAAGLDPRAVHPHRLRRTVATNMLKEFGGDITKLRSYFQWSSLNTASGYVDHQRLEEFDEIERKMLKRSTKI